LPLSRVEPGRNQSLTFAAKGQTAPGEDAAKLPADERAASAQLRADVAGLLTKAEARPK